MRAMHAIIEMGETGIDYALAVTSPNGAYLKGCISRNGALVRYAVVDRGVRRHLVRALPTSPVFGRCQPLRFDSASPIFLNDEPALQEPDCSAPITPVGARTQPHLDETAYNSIGRLRHKDDKQHRSTVRGPGYLDVFFYS